MINKEHLFSISELGKNCGVTTRTIRFYEDKGLINPQRVGGNRVYSYRDKARITLILRLKMVGFTLDQIKEYMDLYNSDKSGITQLKHGFSRINERINKLKDEIISLQNTKSELENLKHEAVEMLKKRGVDIRKIAITLD